MGPLPPPEEREEVIDHIIQSDLEGVTQDYLLESLRSRGPHMTPEVVAVMLRNFEERPDGTWGLTLSPANSRKILAGAFDRDLNAAYPKVQVPVLFMPPDTMETPTRPNTTP